MFTRTCFHAGHVPLRYATRVKSVITFGSAKRHRQNMTKKSMVSSIFDELAKVCSVLLCEFVRYFGM